MTPGETAGEGLGGPPPMVYLARRALRFWRLAFVVFCVAIVATLVFARSTWQPYMSEAVLMFSEQPTREMGGALDPSQAGARLKGMLMSGDRIRPLIQKYQLFPEYSPQQALEEVKKRLDFQVGAGGTFSVKYTGFSPREAQVVLADLTQSLVVDHDRERVKGLKESKDLLEVERKQVGEEVTRHQEALQDFIAKHPEVAQLSEQSVPMPVDSSAVTLMRDLERLKREKAAGQKTGTTSATMTTLLERRRLVEAERDKQRLELDALRATKTEAHPDVVGALQKLKSAEADLDRIDAQIQKTPAVPGAEGASPIDSQIAALNDQLAGMRANRSARTRNPKLLQLEVQLNSLRDQLAQARERLGKIEEKRLQLGVQETMETSGNLLKLNIHDPATLPGSPLQSRRRRAAMIGFVIACMLAAGAALGKAASSDRIFDRMDIAHLAGANVLTVVPPVPRRFRSSL
jgi:uncharacterized protein involved in exopolysaccharide biosynthesis